MVTKTPDRADQAIRRRRARITQLELAMRLGCGVSKVSEYEKHGAPLPWGLTPEDYERALTAAIKAKAGAK